MKTTTTTSAAKQNNRKSFEKSIKSWKKFEKAEKS